LYAEEISATVDPASSILPAALSGAAEGKCRKLFEELAAENFDTRERALQQLVAFGPAVLKLAQEFSSHADAEIAAQARNFRQRLLLNYDGYLPTSPVISEALNKKIDWVYKGTDPVAFLNESARTAGLPLYFDPNFKVAEFPFGIEMPEEGLKGRQGTLREFFATYERWLQLGGIPRGDFFVITRPETAERLATQRHTFQWGELGFSREEAERIGKSLAVFFPAPKTEIHTGSEAFSVRGEEEAIKRAARLIALLRPGTADAIWPPPQTAPAIGELTRKLSTPVSIALASEDPLNVIQQLKKQSHDVFVAPTDAPDGDALQNPPFPRDIDGASPLRLSLHDFPLGLALRWVERRTKFPAEQQAELAMGYEITPQGRLQFRLQPRSRETLKLYLCGADAGFLYPRGSRPGAESDALAARTLRETLSSHLALFPVVNLERDLIVLRGRMFLQGPYATCLRTLELVREWRSKDAPPQPSAWRQTIDARLRTQIDWDGTGMTGGKLLPTLRKRGNIAILLDDSPDGRAPSFQFTPKQAELLPPGKHSLKLLLDELARVAGAEWSVELGAVVIRPGSEK